MCVCNRQCRPSPGMIGVARDCGGEGVPPACSTRVPFRFLAESIGGHGAARGLAYRSLRVGEGRDAEGRWLGLKSALERQVDLRSNQPLRDRASYAFGDQAGFRESECICHALVTPVASDIHSLNPELH